MATHLLALVASVPSGRSFSHGPRREAAAPYASSAVRQMWGTPWERGDAQAREGSVLVADALLLPASRLEPCSPTTARGELHGQNSPLNLSCVTFHIQRWGFLHIMWRSRLAVHGKLSKVNFAENER